MGEKFCNPFRCPPGSSLDPQAASIPCEKRTGCEKADTHRCCVLQTTTTTTWGEVPGVIVADRLCLQLSGCFGCDNDCDCVAKPPNSVPLPPPPIIPVGWCLDHWVETLFIGIVALFLMVPISTCSLKAWAINSTFSQVGDEEGYGYPGFIDKDGKQVGPEKVKKGSMLAEAMDGLTQYTMIGTQNPTLPFETVPLESYKHGHHKEIGVERFKKSENSYLYRGVICTLLLNFLFVALFCFFCIIFAYWFVFWIMTAVKSADSDYTFPVCLPLLSMCPGTSNAGFVTECDALVTTKVFGGMVDMPMFIYNPGCMCYTSLWSLGVALGLVCWWGHWWFWISKRVIFQENESTTASGMVYTGLEQSGINQNAPYGSGAYGPVQWASTYLYGH